MSYFSKTEITSPLPLPVRFPAAFYDAFGRSRVSAPRTVFDSKQIHDAKAIVWDDVTISGTATSTFNANRASSMLAVAGSTAGVRVRQTKRRFNYQPGKSQQIFITCVPAPTGAAAGTTREIGLFDDNNGIFLRVESTGLSWVIRSNVTGAPVENAVASASWNNPDGLGIPAIDVTKAHILIIDFEWLGVGSVRVGFVVNGEVRYVHAFYHANIISSVYMSTPNLPIRYRLAATGAQVGAAQLECICSTVISEGGLDPTGIERSVTRGFTLLTLPNTNTLHPLVAIRLKSTHLGATVVPSGSSILVATPTDLVQWQILVNPTVAGTALAWTPLGDSAIEYDIPAATTSVSGGVVLHSGYGLTAQHEESSISPEGEFSLGSTVAGVSDIVVLAAGRISNAVDVYGELSFREVY